MVQESLSQWVRLADGVASFLTGADYSSATAALRQGDTDGSTDGAVRKSSVAMYPLHVFVCALQIPWNIMFP